MAIFSLNRTELERLLKSFTSRVPFVIFENQKSRRLMQRTLEQGIKNLLRDLKKEPAIVEAQARLLGLYCAASSITVRIGSSVFRLRRPNVEDFSHETLSDLREIFPTDPTAIMDIRIETEKQNAIQEALHKAISILRLYRTVSVRVASYQMVSSSLRMISGGTMKSPDVEGNKFKYLIEHTEIARVQKFWKAMHKALPTKGYGFDQTHVNPREVAYQRLTDATMSRYATVERRIADAVMGLESLLLSDSEKQELGYRLSLRIGALAASLGNDGFTQARVAKLAYGVRSSFVHGSPVNRKDLNKVNDKYGSLEDFLYLILEQLRVSIVVFSLIGISKNSFLERIDDSFIDIPKRSELAKLLAPIRSLASFHEQ